MTGQSLFDKSVVPLRPSRAFYIVTERSSGDPDSRCAAGGGGEVWQELFVLAYRYLRGRGLSHADAEDLAQETLLVTYQRLDGIEPGRLRAWVLTVAHNKHVDWARRQGRAALVAEAPESMDFSDNPLTAALALGDQEEARHLLSALSPADRRLLELRYLENRTVEETAATLGRRVNTTKVGLFRARKRLRAQSEKGRS